MRKGISLFFIFHILFISVQAQVTSPYSVLSSNEYKEPEGYLLYNIYDFGNDGIIQINERGMSSFAFLKFTNDLKQDKLFTVDVKKLFSASTTVFDFEQTKTKAYFFSYNKKLEVAALEFLPGRLNVAEQPVYLFQPSKRVRNNFGYKQSKNKQLQLFFYSLVPKVKRDILSREVIGLHVFDENLNKIWGGEFEIPYSEARFQIIDYLLTNDGSVFLIARVIKKERQLNQPEDATDYQYEIFQYKKDSTVPTSLVITIYDKQPVTVNLMEDTNHHVVVAGLYSNEEHTFINGAYVVRLAASDKKINKINGGFYPLSVNTIKKNASTIDKKWLSKRIKSGKSIGLNNLRLHQVYMMPDASVKLVTEEYDSVAIDNINVFGKNNYIKYDTYAKSIYTFSIDQNGELEWINKIPKIQRSDKENGNELSFSSMVTENTLHILYRDVIRNDSILNAANAPAMYAPELSAYLIAVEIEPSGKLKRYNLGEIENYKTDFYIREFVDIGNQSLMNIERKGTKSILYSIRYNPE